MGQLTKQAQKAAKSKAERVANIPALMRLIDQPRRMPSTPMRARCGSGSKASRSFRTRRWAIDRRSSTRSASRSSARHRLRRLGGRLRPLLRRAANGRWADVRARAHGLAGARACPPSRAAR